jgi:RNA polymerase sigma-70 factor (family 1)
MFEAHKDFIDLNDEMLIASWQQGSEQAFEYIYKKYVLSLTKIAMQKIDDKETAEEMVHDAFMHLYQKKSNLPVIKSISAFLYIIIKRNLLDLYRHKEVVAKYQRYQQYQLNQNQQCTINSSFTLFETKELEKQLEEEIDNIPQKSRTVFKMRRENEMSNKEIAQQLNISENTVEQQHMRKAIRRLKVAFNTELIIILITICFSK